MVTPWSFDCGHPRFSAGVVFARDAAVRVLPWLIMRERELAKIEEFREAFGKMNPCLLYTSPSPRDKRQSRMPSSA